MAHAYQRHTLKDLAVAALKYIDAPAEDADIASGGASYDRYVRAREWANLALQEMSDAHPWEWLGVAFKTITLKDGEYTVNLDEDVHRLMSDPSYEDYTVLFRPVSVQEIQRLRVGSTGEGIPRFIAIAYATDAPTWVVATAYALGDYVQPTTGESGLRYECTTAGTSHAVTEPTWGTTIGTESAADGTAKWTPRTAGRKQLVVWPPADADYTLTLAYTRVVPEMTSESGYPLLPMEMHRVLRLGTMAYASEEGERNWGDGARTAFMAAIENAWRASQPKHMAKSLARHHHYASFGDADEAQNPTVTPPV